MKQKLIYWPNNDFKNIGFVGFTEYLIKNNCIIHQIIPIEFKNGFFESAYVLINKPEDFKI